MKKILSKTMMIIMLVVVMQIGVMSVHTEASNLSYKVQSGDSLYKIGKKFGVSIQKIKSKNGLTSNLICAGRQLTIPVDATQAEKDLLARLVHAEAAGEPYAGKVAVAVVVLNRVSSSKFPNTINGVIYQKGQFTPVANGAIKKRANQDAVKAVNEALALRGTGNGSLYFYNPKKTNNKWLRSKKVTTIIGSHVFAK